MKENEKLKKELEKGKKQTRSVKDNNYEEIRTALLKVKLTLSKEITKGQEDIKVSAYKIFVVYQNTFATGVTNRYDTDEEDSFLYFNVAPKLMIYGLVEANKIAGHTYEKIKTTKEGFAFLRYCEAHPLPIS